MDSWRDRAACKGVPVEVMVPPTPNGKGRHPRAIFEPALAYCQGCPVAEPCLQLALDTNSRDGVFGGTTPADRRKLLNRRGRGRRVAA